MPFRFSPAIAVTELDARQTLGARAQQLWQERAQLDTLKAPERGLIAAVRAYRLLGRPQGA
jgi:hypothetical protein